MECIGKSGLYFSEKHQDDPCYGRMLVLKDFWFWHVDGEKDAAICEQHRRIFNSHHYRRKGFLGEKIQEALTELSRLKPMSS